MRTALVIALAACGTDDPDPPGVYEKVDCDATWKNNGYTTCDGACENSARALGASGQACAVTTIQGSSCQKTFEYDGLTGCCFSSTQTQAVIFGECQFP